MSKTITRAYFFKQKYCHKMLFRFPHGGISLFDRASLGGKIDDVGVPEKRDGFVKPYFTENQEL
jgi:hypothetical protein